MAKGKSNLFYNLIPVGNSDIRGCKVHISFIRYNNSVRETFTNLGSSSDRSYMYVFSKMHLRTHLDQIYGKNLSQF